VEEPVGSLARPLQVATAVDEVTDRLVTAVAIGEFVPGERLPVERALAQMLGVGRSTVHGAMHRLREAGLVEIRRGRNGGAFVRSDWTAASGAAGPSRPWYGPRSPGSRPGAPARCDVGPGRGPSRPPSAAVVGRVGDRPTSGPPTGRSPVRSLGSTADDRAPARLRLHVWRCDPDEWRPGGKEVR